jgi:hypothetical protein
MAKTNVAEVKTAWSFSELQQRPALVVEITHHRIVFDVGRHVQQQGFIGERRRCLQGDSWRASDTIRRTGRRVGGDGRAPRQLKRFSDGLHAAELPPISTDGEGRHYVRLSYKMSYTSFMPDTITFRPDRDASKALEILTKDGTPVSAVVRAALIDAARHKANAAIRAEAEMLADDEADRAEAMQVLHDMETLRAW